MLQLPESELVIRPPPLRCKPRLVRTTAKMQEASDCTKPLCKLAIPRAKATRNLPIVDARESRVPHFSRPLREVGNNSNICHFEQAGARATARRKTLRLRSTSIVEVSPYCLGA